MTTRKRKEREARMDLNKELEELKAKVTPVSTGKFIMGTLISLGTAAAVVGLFKNPIDGAKGLTKLMIDKAASEGKTLVIECDPLQEVTKHIARKFGFSWAGSSDGLDVFRL